MPAALGSLGSECSEPAPSLALAFLGVDTAFPADSGGAEPRAELSVSSCQLPCPALGKPGPAALCREMVTADTGMSPPPAVPAEPWRSLQSPFEA